MPEDKPRGDAETRKGSLIVPVLIGVLALLAGLAAWIFWPDNAERTEENPSQTFKKQADIR